MHNDNYTTEEREMVGKPKYYLYKWHGRFCAVLLKPVFRKGIKRNALIEFTDGEKMTVTWRSLRRSNNSTEVRYC